MLKNVVSEKQKPVCVLFRAVKVNVKILNKWNKTIHSAFRSHAINHDVIVL